jgi:hypothetical protein
MAENVQVEIGGQSKYEVAHRIAINIIKEIEKKQLRDVTRQQYLHAVADAIDALQGIKR